MYLCDKALNQLVYIGNFECLGSSLIVMDPHLCPVNNMMEGVYRDNSRQLYLRRAVAGLYHCYHLVDVVNQEILSLVAVHGAYGKNALEDMGFENIGNIVTSGGNLVGIVDQSCIYDTENLYYAMDEDSMYDARQVLSDLEQMDYTVKMKKAIKELCRVALEERGFVKGGDLLDIIQCSPIWDGFRKYGEKSNAWSTQIEKTIYDGVVPAAMVYGGIASIAPPSDVSCYVARNMRGDTVAISLNMAK